MCVLLSQLFQRLFVFKCSLFQDKWYYILNTYDLNSSVLPNQRLNCSSCNHKTELKRKTIHKVISMKEEKEDNKYGRNRHVIFLKKFPMIYPKLIFIKNNISFSMVLCQIIKMWLWSCGTLMTIIIKLPFLYCGYIKVEVIKVEVIKVEVYRHRLDLKIPTKSFSLPLQVVN